MRTRTQLIDALRGLAHDARKLSAGETAQRLDDVADAVAGMSTAQWHGADLRSFVEPEQLLRTGDRRGSLVGMLEHARDVMMLVPIVITWLGVGLALAAYDAYTSQHSRQDAQQSFLYLWETGLGNHWYFRLSTVAIADVGAIGLIITLLLVVPLVDWIRNDGRRRAAAELEQNVRGVLGEASIHLNGAAAAEAAVAVAPAAREAAIVREITGGAELAEPVEAMARAVGRLSTRLDEFTQEQKDLSQRLLETLGELKDTAITLKAGFDALGRAAAAFAIGEEKFLREIDRQIAAQGEVAARLREVSAPLTETLRGTKEYAAELQRFVEHLRDMDDTLLRFQKEAIQLHRRALEEMRSAAEHVRQQAEPLPRAVPVQAPDRPRQPDRAPWLREDSP